MSEPSGVLPRNTEYNPYVPPQPLLARTKSNPAYLIVASSLVGGYILLLIPFWISNSSGALFAHAIFGFFLGFAIAFAGVIVLLVGRTKYGPGRRSKPLLTQLGAFIGIALVLEAVVEIIIAWTLYSLSVVYPS